MAINSVYWSSIGETAKRRYKITNRKKIGKTSRIRARQQITDNICICRYLQIQIILGDDPSDTDKKTPIDQIMPISASAVCKFLLICVKTYGVYIWEEMSSFEPLLRDHDISNTISLYSPGVHLHSAPTPTL